MPLRLNLGRGGTGVHEVFRKLVRLRSYASEDFKTGND